MPLASATKDINVKLSPLPVLGSPRGSDRALEQLGLKTIGHYSASRAWRSRVGSAEAKMLSTHSIDGRKPEPLTALLPCRPPQTVAVWKNLRLIRKLQVKRSIG